MSLDRLGNHVHWDRRGFATSSLKLMSVINDDDGEDVEDDADDAVVVVGGCFINPQPLQPATSAPPI